MPINLGDLTWLHSNATTIMEQAGLTDPQDLRAWEAVLRQPHVLWRKAIAQATSNAATYRRIAWDLHTWHARILSLIHI